MPEPQFVKTCLKCGKCSQVCPHDSIDMAHLQWGEDYGTPLIFPREVPCYVCLKCPPVCPSGALDNELTRKEDTRMGIAKIDESRCLPYNEVICKACFQQCPMYREAITLPDEMRPVVDPDKCIGCGICEHVCLTEPAAITVRSAHEI